MSERILIIDDDQQIRELLECTLKVEEFEVVTAENGKEGIEKCRKEKFHMVFTDIEMPEMDGFEVISILQKEFPDIKIVGMSGDVDMIDRLGKYKVLYNVLQKPFHLRDVADIVGKFY